MLKRFITILLAAGFLIPLSAQTWMDNYDEIGDFCDGLAIIRKNDKYGYVDQNGLEVIPCIYDEVGKFSEGLAVVRNAKKYGYVNTNGQEVIPCNYSAVGSFNEQGLVWVNSRGWFKTGTNEITGGKFGVYNKDGKIIIPIQYYTIGVFNPETSSDGSPYFLLPALSELSFQEMYKSGKYNHKANAMFAPENKSDAITNIKWIAQNECFFDIHEPMPLKPILFSKLDMSQGNYIAVLESKYKAAPSKHYYNRPVYLSAEERGKNRWGVYSAEGQLLLPTGKYDIIYNPSEGYIPVAQLKSGEFKVNYYNIATQKLAFNEWKKAIAVSPVVAGKAMIVEQKATEVNLTDLATGVVMKTYDAVFPSKHGVYVVLNNKKYGLIDAAGNAIISTICTSISVETNGLLIIQPSDIQVENLAKLDGQGGVTQLENASFSSISHFRKGRAMVTDRVSKQLGLINENGEYLLQPDFKDIIVQYTMEDDSIFWAMKNTDSIYHAYKIFSNEQAFKNGYEKAFAFGALHNDVAPVLINKLWGMVSIKGETVLPCEFASLKDAENEYQMRSRDGLPNWRAVDGERRIAQTKKDMLKGELKLSEKIDDSHWDY
ncbi:MAG: WG repeat-containing protein [Bacteroidales bacterium]|nr:WG repeat-containing protein [Bacteroidales bacterium]